MIVSYVLLRQNRQHLYLNPYLHREKVGLWDAEETVAIKSSGMLSQAQKDEAAYSLYTAIDYSVDRWIQDKQYVPRLLICAIVFTATYFLMSLGIRDPIPMVDELVGSTALSIFCWAAMAKRDTRSSLAQKKRYELKKNASHPDYQITEQLFCLEEYLQNHDQMDALQLANTLCLCGNETLEQLSFDGDAAMMAEVGELLFLHLQTYDKGLFHLVMKVYGQRESKHQDPKLAARLFHLAVQQRLDLSLLSLCITLKENWI